MDFQFVKMDWYLIQNYLYRQVSPAGYISFKQIESIALIDQSQHRGVSWLPVHEIQGSASQEAISEELYRKEPLLDNVLSELQTLEENRDTQIRAVALSTKTQGSPWLERTRWYEYVRGMSLDETGKLGCSACPIEEGVICELGRAIDRLVEAAYCDVREDRINFFGLKRIASFIPGREVYSRPLVVKLQEGTYRQYKMVWKRAVAFVCRSAYSFDCAKLPHSLNSEQTARLDAALRLAEEHIAHPHCTTELLDRKCLDLCVSLLDQRLTGNVYSSALVGSLAILGIDEANETFLDATRYTPKLSAFIKIAQLFVLRKAILQVEEGTAVDPLDALDAMRLRFMTLNNPTPFTWALQLRAFGKQIRDSSTSIGYVRWSDDAETLYYCKVKLSLDAFRHFIRQQVLAAQKLLHCLLLIGIDDDRRSIVPPFSLSQLCDNPANTAHGWNFLQDSRNQKVFGGGDTLLLQRVLEESDLREEFGALRVDGSFAWSRARFQRYKILATEFLEMLLLLVHITGGQPARASEILGLAHVNTACHRNIFLEEGLIAIVTSYHKGYTCTGTTKIIHRYLPLQVSELLVIYLWLVLSFIQKVGLLLHGVTSKEVVSNAITG
ncbi:hypothetical protein LTR86_010994 [Recurvomyces mirabilis]|nr:hypothetical protein LTR86_010994 [Recurvomyces mirabilis]